MRLFVERGGSARGGERARAEDISIDDLEATVGDLSRALGFDPGVSLNIDGLLHEPSERLCDVELVEGSAVARADVAALEGSGTGSVWIGVSSGPGAGSLVRVPHGTRVSVGRDPTNDLHIDNTTVSTRHAVIHVDPEGALDIEDLGSRNGTWVGGRAVSDRTPWTGDQPVRLGSSRLSVHRVDRRERLLGATAAQADSTGRVLLNRPPRSTGPSGPGPITLPSRVVERALPGLAVVSLLAPLVFAGVMVVALGSWRYAIFGLLSPVIALGNWFSGRRLVKKQSKGDVTHHVTALDRLGRELQEAEHLERRRRSAYAPDIVEVRRRIELPARELWERRLSSPDAMTVRLGVGESPWDIEIEAARDEPDPEASEVVDAAQRLDEAEVLIDLRNGPVGLVGSDDHARAAIRSMLIQLCTHHGPADLHLAIFTTAERVPCWEWVDWLPHASTTPDGAVVVGDRALGMSASMLETMSADGQSLNRASALWVVVVDDVELLHGRSSPVRRLLELREAVHGIVLTPGVDQLPSSISTIVEIEDVDGLFTMHNPQHADRKASGGLDLVSLRVAADLARAMARFEDPEAHQVGGTLPAVVTARDVDGGEPSSDGIRLRWAAQSSKTSLEFTLGIGASGPLSVDLVADGPHALIAGTTGSGKSELLRSLVLGLALNHSPADVVFVLIDYKGGSAFDRCANLPHVVGVVTDLDEHLAERALQSLDAELKYRERLLRSAGVSDIDQFRRSSPSEGPLPRLVVIIDEFATLRQELPEFVASLVSIAQRGRSLGVHLLLATQRPSGSVDANIRANANLRIALRVQSAADSVDVLDSPAAAQIDRRTPGRALVRRGQSELAAVQTAYISGPLERAGARVRVVGGRGQDESDEAPIESRRIGASRTELDVLVDAIVDAADSHALPRRPWLEPLPGHVTAADLAILEPHSERDAVVGVAIGDAPAMQCRVQRGWDPATGHVSVTGVLGSGVTTTLRTVIAGLSCAKTDRPIWVFAADHAGGGLEGIDRWPHVSCCLDPTEEGRHSRLLSFLGGEIDRRRALSLEAIKSQPLLVLAIDGVGAFVDALGAEAGTPAGDILARIGRDGPSIGLVMVLGATKASEVPRSVRGHLRTLIVLEQAEVSDYATTGFRASTLPSFVPGRALWSPDPMVCQIVKDDLPVDAFAQPALDDGVDAPPPIEELASVIDRTCLPQAAIGPHLVIPIGVADATREIAVLTVRSGEHVTVAGPPGSGRTSALRLFAAQLREASSDVVLVGVNPSGSGGLLDEPTLDAGGALADIEHVLAMAIDDDRRWVILVDDADRIDVDDGPLVSLAAKPPANVTVSASMRSSAGRGAYGHWTRRIRASGVGILLCPDNAVDGELLGLRLPRLEQLRKVPGRGYLVRSEGIEAVQLGHHM